ncbi:STAS domain-containing protein [Streptacidiphilus sp. 4-A2]|nr:STAS domain-containing protein [Streptacidiphilus sp. 4-A2]
MAERPRRPAVRTVGQDLQGATVVEFHGDIDIATTYQSTRHLDAATAGTAPLVVLDLRGVTFIDSTGLGPISRAWCRAVDRGGDLILLCTEPRILSILRLAGLTPTIAVTRFYPRMFTWPA